MTYDDLALQCAKSINSSTEIGLPNQEAFVLLVLPKGWKPPPKFPRGKTAHYKDDGTRVAYFNAMNVLAWMAGNGLVKIELPA